MDVVKPNDVYPRYLTRAAKYFPNQDIDVVLSGNPLAVSIAHLKHLRKQYKNQFPSSIFPIKNIQQLMKALPNPDPTASFNNIFSYASLVDAFISDEKFQQGGPYDLSDKARSMITDMYTPTECSTTMNFSENGIFKLNYLTITMREAIINAVCNSKTKVKIEGYDIRIKTSDVDKFDDIYKGIPEQCDTCCPFLVQKTLSPRPFPPTMNVYSHRLYCGWCWCCTNPIWCYFDCASKSKTSGADCEHRAALFGTFIAGMLAAQNPTTKTLAYFNAHIHCNRYKSSFVGIRMDQNYRFIVDPDDIDALADEIMTETVHSSKLHKSEHDGTLRQALNKEKIQNQLDVDYELWCNAANRIYKPGKPDYNLDRCLFRLVDSILIGYGVEWLGEWINLMEQKTGPSILQIASEKFQNKFKPSGKSKVVRVASCFVKRAVGVVKRERKYSPFTKKPASGGASKDVTDALNTDDLKEFYFDNLEAACFLLDELIVLDADETDLLNELENDIKIKTEIEQIIKKDIDNMISLIDSNGENQKEHLKQEDDLKKLLELLREDDTMDDEYSNFAEKAKEVLGNLAKSTSVCDYYNEDSVKRFSEVSSPVQPSQTPERFTNVFNGMAIKAYGGKKTKKSKRNYKKSKRGSKRKKRI
jgi:hypothetical protein